jgi:hypothetical protein
MPVRDVMRRTQRTLAALDAAHLRATTRLDQARARRAEVLAARLRGPAARAYQVFLDDLVRRGCAALGCRVTGPDPLERLCARHLRGEDRVVVAFQGETRAWVLLVGAHRADNPGADFYEELYRLAGVRPPSDQCRRKPPCCDDGGRTAGARRTGHWRSSGSRPSAPPGRPPQGANAAGSTNILRRWRAACSVLLSGVAPNSTRPQPATAEVIGSRRYGRSDLITRRLVVSMLVGLRCGRTHKQEVRPCTRSSGQGCNPRKTVGVPLWHFLDVKITL